jgi:chromosomal replication initiation ATPase DnaA
MKTLRKWFIQSYGIASYFSWFEFVEFGSFDGSILILQVPSQFLKEWIETNYRIDLCDHLSKQHRNVNQVEFIVAKKHVHSNEHKAFDNSTSSPTQPERT